MIGKTDLINAIAPTNRGLLATESQKQAILAAIANLEDRNPTPRPVEAANLLDGNWQLLYTTSKGLLNLDSLPLCKLGQIYQCIRVETTSVYNIAEIYGLPYLEGIVGLQRLLDYNSPENFIHQIESGKKFLGIDVPLNSEKQQGWLDITYIDSDLRIGRGNEGSVFVLRRT
jgi:hypothetical protein